MGEGGALDEVADKKLYGAGDEEGQHLVAGGQRRQHHLHTRSRPLSLLYWESVSLLKGRFHPRLRTKLLWALILCAERS